nr:unnamed protein product [Spirometra erinaceieuropaei]
MQLDVAGPLLRSNDFAHLLTCVDRHIRAAGAISSPNDEFESAPFQTLLNVPGCKSILKTAHNPAANVIVEVFHRQPNTALRATEYPSNWSNNLFTVLLGNRSALKSDLDCSIVELVFSTTFGLPGEMVTPTSHGLANCTRVFVRRAGVQKPLKSPYQGPIRVLSLSAKTGRAHRGDKEDIVSVDRVKAAVAEGPSDLVHGQHCANLLFP